MNEVLCALMVFNRGESNKLLDLLAPLIEKHLHQICLLVKFYRIIPVTSSGNEYFKKWDFGAS